MKSIFIQIAAYRDSELVPTIRDLISKSSGQNSLFFGICWQRESDESLEEFSQDDRFRIYDTHWSQSRGLGWARAQSQKLYNNEDYVLQIDSHSRFIYNWDNELINMVKNLKYKSEKPLLTTYGASYDPDSGYMDKDPIPNKLVPIDFKSSGTIWFKRVPIINHTKLNEPINARFVGGGFFFTIGQHSQEYKYDPHLYFAGDELSLSLRSYTMGYDLYHPHKNILWHFYQRHNRIKHWNDHNKKNSKTQTVWWETDKISKQRLNKLISGGNLENYGCGSVRSIGDYEKYSGFDFDKKRILSKARNGYDPPLEYNEESFKTNQKIIIDWQDINTGTYEIKLIHLSKKYIIQNIDTSVKEISINTDNPIMKYEILKDNKIILSKELYHNIPWH